jgi:hypothetical protein
LVNMCSSVTIVLVNKMIFNGYEFRFPLALCFIHTCVTALGLHAAAAWPGGLQKKEIPFSGKVYMGACYAAFVASSVLSIQLNPVGEDSARSMHYLPSMSGIPLPKEERRDVAVVLFCSCETYMALATGPPCAGRGAIPGPADGAESIAESGRQQHHPLSAAPQASTR